MRAGANPSSTPTWSCCGPHWNQTPPRAASDSGFGVSSSPTTSPKNARASGSQPRRGRELDVVECDHAHAVTSAGTSPSSSSFATTSAALSSGSCSSVSITISGFDGSS